MLLDKEARTPVIGEHGYLDREIFWEVTDGTTLEAASKRASQIDRAATPRRRRGVGQPGTPSSERPQGPAPKRPQSP